MTTSTLQDEQLEREATALSAGFEKFAGSLREQHDGDKKIPGAPYLYRASPPSGFMAAIGW